MKSLDFSLIIFTCYFFNKIYCIQPILRNKILSRQDNKCGLCKNNFSKLIPHEIHHINHVSTDNDINNLLALCCNCHSAHHRFNVSVKPFFYTLKNYTEIEPYLSDSF